MSSMEPEVRDFLKRIVFSFFLGLCWLFVNMTVGIFFGWMFFEGRPSLGNWIFYTFFAGSLVLILRWLWRTWKKKFPHG